jgi:hypothetical protein
MTFSLFVHGDTWNKSKCLILFPVYHLEVPPFEKTPGPAPAMVLFGMKQRLQTVYQHYVVLLMILNFQCIDRNKQI